MSSDVIKKMKAHGLKITKNRTIIASFLATHEGPFTVEQIHQKIPVTCDLATVYRTVRSLAKENIIQTCDFRDGHVRYEINPEGKGHYHHIVCLSCRKQEKVMMCLGPNWKQTVERNHRFTGITHRLEFFGYCSQCEVS